MITYLLTFLSYYLLLCSQRWLPARVFYQNVVRSKLQGNFWPEDSRILTRETRFKA